METGLQKTLKLLKKYEGFRDTVYLDGNGIPTIGYGFTDPELIKKGKITLKEADSRLTKEIAARYNTLKDTLPNFEKLSDDSKAALISYHFNYPAGFKDTTRFMKYWTAGDYLKAIKEVDAGMNDPKNPGLRPMRLEELAMLSNDPFLSGITSVKTKDGNKMLRFPVPENREYKSTWEPTKPVKTIYPLNNTTPESISSWSGADAPNATPRLKDFLEVRQEDLNRGVDVNGDPVSPFSLRLRLPSLTSLLQLNSPLKLAEQYFADALGISDMLPLTPSLFPKLKNGKLPRFVDGNVPGGDWYNNLNPFYQWISKQYNIGNQEALDKFTGDSSYPYALESVYNTVKSYKPDYTIQDIYQEANIDLDIYDAMQKFGYHTKPFGEIKPEEWLKVDSLYRAGENTWKKNNPYKSYSSREKYGNGKLPRKILPRFANGSDPDGYPLEIPEIIAIGKNKSNYSQEDKFNAAKNWLTGTWLPGRKKFLLDRIDDLITEYLQSTNYDPYNIDWGNMLKVVSSKLNLRQPDLVKQYDRNQAAPFANMDTFKQYLRNRINWDIDEGIKAINNALLVNHKTALEADYPDFHRKFLADARFENPNLGAYVLDAYPTHVFGRGDNSISELIHELNHIGQRYYTGIPMRHDEDYLDKDLERHSRMMLYRYENSEDPLKFIYPELEDLQDYNLNSSDDFNYIAQYANGKSPIHIKPANRGKLTRLKKRTGKSEAELYKTGGPAVRKMITFARNSRKWKH